MNSSNPVLSDKVLDRASKLDASAGVMTVSGSVAKTGFLLALVIAAASFSWKYTADNPTSALWFVSGASIAALIVALPIIFGKLNAVLVVLYAALEGLVLGSISQLFNSQYAGSVMQAVVMTIAITVGMLFLYASGIIKVTEKVRSVIIIATVGVLLYYLFSFVVGLFSPAFVAAMNSGSLGIVFAAVVVLIASFNLLLDFDFIDKGSAQKLPAKYEWYAAFGLMVTLIWLYISILRLLGRSR